MSYLWYALAFLSLLGTSAFLYIAAVEVYYSGFSIVTRGKFIASIFIVFIPFVATLLFLIGFVLVALENLPDSNPRLYQWLEEPLFAKNLRRMSR